MGSPACCFADQVLNEHCQHFLEQADTHVGWSWLLQQAELGTFTLL